MKEIKEGWWMPGQSRKFHYFVEGRALCGGWIFPDYNSLTPDTGNTVKLTDDCAGCFKKLVKLRASRFTSEGRTDQK